MGSVHVTLGVYTLTESAGKP